MKNIIAFSALILTFFSCGKNSSDPKQITQDFEKFTMQIPESWLYIKQQGIDSHVGQIKINYKEVIGFDLGWYSNQLNVDSATHDIRLTTIDSKNAKIVKPKNPGQGITGIYIDSLAANKKDKFEMHAVNLTSKNQQLFLTAMETLKFK